MRDRNHPLLIGGTIVVLITLGALLGGYLLSHDPAQGDLAERLEGPSPNHPLGTDHFGRDILSRIWQGSRIALSVGGGAVVLGLVGGLAIGSIAGLWKGWGAELLMRLMDALLAFPGVLLAMALAAVLGPSQSTVIIALGVGNIPIFARLARAAVLMVEKEQFVLAARVLGAGPIHIWWRHILPNGLPSLLAQASLSFATAIIVEAGLSFLGLGTQPPLASWGRMLSEARDYMGLSPWMALFPGLALAITVLGFNLLGEGIRRALNPRRR